MTDAQISELWEKLPPYAPYGLTFYQDGKLWDTGHSFDPLEVWVKPHGTIEIRRYWMFNGSFKPVLRPESFLTKRLHHGMEECVPLIEIARASMSFPFEWEVSPGGIIMDKKRSVQFQYRGGTFYAQDLDIHETLDVNNYLAVKKAHELMIDLGGLIDKGLALSTENFDEDPYA